MLVVTFTLFSHAIHVKQRMSSHFGAQEPGPGRKLHIIFIYGSHYFYIILIFCEHLFFLHLHTDNVCSCRRSHRRRSSDTCMLLGTPWSVAVSIMLVDYSGHLQEPAVWQATSLWGTVCKQLACASEPRQACFYTSCQHVVVEAHVMAWQISGTLTLARGWTASPEPRFWK